MNVILPAMIVPGVLFTVLAAYPFIEAYITGDRREHHVLDRPRNAPVRTSVGVAILTGFVVLVLAGSNDIIATHFGLSINDITNVYRFVFLVAPFLAFWVTRRVCLGLQRKDRELVLHGHETGRIVRFASGEYIEVHRPLDPYERWIRVAHEPRRPAELLPAVDERGVRRRGYRKDAVRARLSRFFYEDRVEPVTPAELAAAQSHGEHDAGPAIEGRHRAPELTGGDPVSARSDGAPAGGVDAHRP
jgi:ubiquinol-cytochrome c reductase cytochrome b subunit